MPALNSARFSARSVTSLSNLRQLGIGLTIYVTEHKGMYPGGAYPTPSPAAPRIRWADAIYPYMKNTEVYMSPLLDERDRARMLKPWAHTLNPDGTTNPTTKYFGGYGYNYQYLGNGRHLATANSPYNLPYHGKAGSDIAVAAQTIAVADTNGTRKGSTTGDDVNAGFTTDDGVYTIDPPLQSLELGSKSSRKTLSGATNPLVNNYGYDGGSDGNATHALTRRSFPAERNKGKRVNVVFCDGHGESMKLKDIDDFNGDGVNDNGWWNGKADASLR